MRIWIWITSSPSSSSSFRAIEKIIECNYLLYTRQWGIVYRLKFSLFFTLHFTRTYGIWSWNRRWSLLNKTLKKRRKSFLFNNIWTFPKCFNIKNAFTSSSSSSLLNLVYFEWEKKRFEPRWIFKYQWSLKSYACFSKFCNIRLKSWNIFFKFFTVDAFHRVKRQSSDDSSKKSTTEDFERELCKEKEAGEWFRLIAGDGDNCRDVIQCTSSVSIHKKYKKKHSIFNNNDMCVRARVLYRRKNLFFMLISI